MRWRISLDIRKVPPVPSSWKMSATRPSMWVSICAPASSPRSISPPVPSIAGWTIKRRSLPTLSSWPLELRPAGSDCPQSRSSAVRKRTTVVIGGGDTALEDALYLSQLCAKVYIVHRRREFRGTAALQKLVLNTPNIEVVWNHVPVDILGQQEGFIKKVTGLQVREVETGEERVLEVNGVFEAIGVTPQSDLFKGQLEMDAQGYIITQPGTGRTNVPGVFAAGDVQDPHYRQGIVAAGSGAIAGIEASRFLMGQ